MSVKGVIPWEELIGGTPLVKLENIKSISKINLFAKLEMFNPGGSMKDRASLNIIKDALDKKLIRPGSTVIESSSGNMGVGIAQACLRYGLNFICVADCNTNPMNIKIMETYGARVEIISHKGASSSLLEARLNRIKELLKIMPNSFWCNQYSNESNPNSHWKTMEEIDKSLGGIVDFLFCATGTCGTLRGCSEYVTKHSLNTTVVAVDAVGSVIFGQKSRSRLIPGHGAAIKPPLFRKDLAKRVVHVDDLDCVRGCRKILDQEALLVGGSSGAVISAVEKIQHEIPRDANVVMILADRGERYLDTVYNDEWLAANNLVEG